MSRSVDSLRPRSVKFTVCGAFTAGKFSCIMIQVMPEWNLYESGFANG